MTAMPAPNVSTCSPWATEEDLCGPCVGYDSTLDPYIERGLVIASDVLFRLSGQQFPGVCEGTIRPCCKPSSGALATIDPLMLVRYLPATWTPAWGFCSCAGSDRCGLGGSREVKLPNAPVNEVSEVKVDGDILDPADYFVDDEFRLVRRDGVWPCCQRNDLDDTEVGTWSVTYSWGTPPPPAGVLAAAVLGCEIAMACDPETPEDKCRLPRRVTSIIRQGITIVMAPSDFLDPRTGKVGIYEVDLFVATYNPAHLQEGGVVLSPDTFPTSRTRTTP